MSNIFYDGRNIIPRANAKGRCLLENYVEERAIADLDRQREAECKDQLAPVRGLWDGHKGLLTTDTNAATVDLTSHLDAFRPYTGPVARTKGSRRELQEQMLYEQAVREVEKELNPPVDDEIISTTQTHFNIDGFNPCEPLPTAERDYTLEQPVTFWTEHKDRIHSTTQFKPTFNTCFRKNTAFSRPISERWEPDHVLPYERDHVPNM